MRKRLKVYHDQTEPLVEYYAKWSDSGDSRAPKHVRIDGIGSVDAIRDKIFAALG